MTVYNSSRSHFFILLVRWIPYTIFVILIGRLIIEGISANFEDQEIIIALIIISLTFGVLVWFVERILKMKYTIDGDYLIVDTGLSLRKIKINHIQSINASSYSAYGYKPALDFKGIQVIYESGRIMYISPENKDKFMSELKKINNKIVFK